MKLKSVAVLGAGAVGAYLIWGLSKRPEIDLCVIAEGERKERFERDGFVINGLTYHPTIKTPAEAHGVDVLFVTVKYNALEGALADVKEIVGEKTLVLSLMNGVDSEERILKAIGDVTLAGVKMTDSSSGLHQDDLCNVDGGTVAEAYDKKTFGGGRVLHSLIKIASERVGNNVKFDPEGTVGIIMGELDLARGNERTDAVAALFEGTGVKTTVTDYILEEIWSKFRLNVSNNQPQAMIDCGVGAYEDSVHAGWIRQALQDELEAIAKAKGIDLSLLPATSKFGSQAKKRARFSTLQDLDAKRHTEVDMFAGEIVRMGKELGVPTPYNEFTYHMIKALEEKNDGLFDYE